MGGKFHLKLNIGERPIANKYREGKMKRTLKRELTVLEIAKREALETSRTGGYIFISAGERCAFGILTLPCVHRTLVVLSVPLGGSASIRPGGESLGECAAFRCQL